MTDAAFGPLSVPCLFSVEIETESGYRSWSRPMVEVEVNAYIDMRESWGDFFSDCDHTVKWDCMGTCSFPIQRYEDWKKEMGL